MRLPPEAAPFASRELPAFAKRSIVAHVGRELVGFFRYDRYKHSLADCGAWVAPAYRRCGIGRALLVCALEHEHLPLHVTCVSIEGTRLVASVQRTHPMLRLNP